MHMDTKREGKEHNYLKQNMPLVEICGYMRVLIENHQGIIAYSAEQVCVGVNFGFLDIRGNALKIVRICKEKLIISGDIETVNFRRRG